MARDVKVQRARQALDDEIAELQQQAARARRRHPKQPVAVESASQPAPAPTEQPLPSTTPPSLQGTIAGSSSPLELDADQTAAIALLDTRTQRLSDIKQWITEDSDLLPLIARVVGDIESKYMRRNLIINILLSTIFLLAGWLLSIVATPTNLVHLFGQ